jgi:hypothetical protein
MKNIGRLGGAKRNLIIINMDNKKDKRVTDHAWRTDNISITVVRQVHPIRIEQIRFSIIDKLFKV